MTLVYQLKQYIGVGGPEIICKKRQFHHLLQQVNFKQIIDCVTSVNMALTNRIIATNTFRVTISSEMNILDRQIILAALFSLSVTAQVDDQF